MEREGMKNLNLWLPNKTSLNAMEEARQGKGKIYATVEEMFVDMDIVENIYTYVDNIEKGE